ncbi:sensor histidine kinase [Caldimonas tepidiphila]|uniref:sensor histidine kinase n=1 Tax=Caldimonas tepidiphila TaxID=2315841 RepID=UPI000E5B54FC|nr:sensor histidine kinase [Caldimonas tepidiphila]
MSGFPPLRWAALVAVLVLAVAGTASVLAVRTQGETDAWVAHTHQVIGQLESTLRSLTEAEAAQRVYLLTGDEAELQPFEAASRELEAHLEALARLTADNPRQQQRLPALRSAAAARLQSLAEAAALRREGDLRGALALVRDRGRVLMGEVRAQIAALRQEEDRLLQARLEDAARAAGFGMAATAGTGVLALVLLLSLYLASSRHAARLAAEQRELRRSREETQLVADALRVANEGLRRATAELEDRVAERTAALADANAQLESFAHTVAHDLRAPLRNIQGFAAALLEDEAPRMSEEGADYARRVAAGAVRMDGLISDLLAYSRLARSRLPCERVGLESLVQEVVRELAPDIGRSGAELTVSTPIPDVLAHRATLAQVLTNLVANALKFVPPGTPPRIRISARPEGEVVALTVADQGIGIDPAHHERIFSVFERLHGPERYPGSGIGLAIVRKGVERMGGQVRLDSAPGAGSRFTIELPAADGEGA